MSKLSFVLALFFSGIYFAQEPTITITSKDFVMSPKAASDYAREVVYPLLVKHAKDPLQVPGLRKRLNEFFRLTAEGTLCGYPAPFYQPGVKRAVAQITYVQERGKPCVMLFVPAVQVYQREEPAEFDEGIALVIAHEIIHWETDREHLSQHQAPARSPYEKARVEALAWGIEILEIARPLMQRGHKVSQSEVRLSKVLKRWGDNPRSRGWIRYFLDYGKDGWNPAAVTRP